MDKLIFSLIYYRFQSYVECVLEDFFSLGSKKNLFVPTCNETSAYTLHKTHTLDAEQQFNILMSPLNNLIEKSIEGQHANANANSFRKFENLMSESILLLKALTVHLSYIKEDNVKNIISLYFQKLITDDDYAIQTSMKNEVRKFHFENYHQYGE